MQLVSKVSVLPTLRGERPAYGKRRRPIFSPRVKARWLMMRMLPIGRVQFATRARVLRRLYK